MLTYFASGANRPGEPTGFADAGCDLGVAVCDVNDETLRELAALPAPTRIFVDSGAFGEITFERGFPEVRREITPLEWTRRLRIYRRLAEALGARAFVVAPDKVAFQADTLERLRTYAGEVREIAELGAQVIVPIQKGALSMAAFWKEANATLGAGRWIAGIPMKKDATSLAELRAFLIEARPTRLHLLGLGPYSPRWAETLTLINEAAPGIELSCDSVRITALVGRTNGPGKTPRPITAAQDQIRAEGILLTAAVKAEAIRRVFGIERAANPELWIEKGWRL